MDTLENKLFYKGKIIARVHGDMEQENGLTISQYNPKGKQAVIKKVKKKLLLKLHDKYDVSVSIGAVKSLIVKLDKISSHIRYDKFEFIKTFELIVDTINTYNYQKVQILTDDKNRYIINSSELIEKLNLICLFNYGYDFLNKTSLDT